jgi:hypothetical protein
VSFCPNVQVDHGSVDYINPDSNFEIKQENSTITLTCNDFYEISQPESRVCHNGEWDGNSGICVRNFF